MIERAQPKPDVRDRAPAAARHSAARLAAIQALYQIELTGAGVAQVLDEFPRIKMDEEVAGNLAVARPRMFQELVRGVVNRGAELDGLLAPLIAEGWSLERLEIILRCILRAGAFELVARSNVPARVVITEYVDLAHAFFAGGERAMVNGVLDRLARDVRPGELEARSP